MRRACDRLAVPISSKTMTERNLMRVCALIGLSLAALGILAVWRATLASYSPLPFWDQWERIGSDQILSRIFDPHNEHRLAVPSLFFLGDVALFGGRQVFLLLAIQTVQAMHAGLMIGLVRQAGLRGTDLFGAAALVVALMFAGVQIENFYWGFQISFVLVYLLATVCFACAALRVDDRRCDLVAGVAGAAAVFAMSNGLFVLPIAVAAALLMGAPGRRISVLIAFAALSWAFYLRDYHPMTSADPAGALEQPLNTIYYALVYLGGPLGGTFGGLIGNLGGNPLHTSAALGLSGLLAGVAAGLAVIMWRKNGARLALLGVMTLCTLSAGTTAAGRWQFGTEQALASRYATPALLFWTSLALLIWSFREELPRPAWRWASWVFLAGTPLTAGVLLASAPAWTAHARTHGDQLRTAESAVVTGTFDAQALASLYPDPQKVLDQSKILRERRLSVFTRREAAWVGQPLEFLNLSSVETCIGAFDARDTLATGSGEVASALHASGWAWMTEERRPPRLILFVGDGGTVVGVAYTGFDRPDVRAAIPNVGAARVGWSGHANVFWINDPMTAYAVGYKGLARRAVICRIGAQ